MVWLSSASTNLGRRDLALLAAEMPDDVVGDRGISPSEYQLANEGIVLLPPDDPILMPLSTARVTFVPAGSFTLREPRSPALSVC